MITRLQDVAGFFREIFWFVVVFFKKEKTFYVYSFAARLVGIALGVMVGFFFSATVSVTSGIIFYLLGWARFNYFEAHPTEKEEDGSFYTRLFFAAYTAGLMLRLLATQITLPL